MEKFRQGGSPVIVVEAINPLTGQLNDVGAMNVTIKDDQDGNTIINLAGMTHTSLGTYLYQFQLSGTARIGQWWMFRTITDVNGFVNPEEPEPAFEVTA